MRPSLQDRLILSSRRAVTGCLIWQGAKITNGYGSIRSGGRQRGAHRISYEIAYGSIPSGMQVCHKCDVKLCIEPTHLFLGTNADNMADKMAKGRQARGERVAQSVLTADQVRAIRDDRRVLSKIAKDYGVSETNISYIKRRIFWKHVA